MRILIQNCFKYCYLKSLGEWTDNPDEAMTFPSSERALAFCTEHRIPDAQLVLKFEYDEYDVTLPFTDDCRRAPKKPFLMNRAGKR
jgi:hypothetical protein